MNAEATLDRPATTLDYPGAKLAVHHKYPNALIAFDLGGGYVLLYEDAILAGRELGLAVETVGDCAQAGFCADQIDYYADRVEKLGRTMVVCPLS